MQTTPPALSRPDVEPPHERARLRAEAIRFGHPQWAAAAAVNYHTLRRWLAGGGGYARTERAALQALENEERRLGAHLASGGTE